MKKILSKLISDRFKQEFKIKMGAPHMYWSIRNLKNNGLDASKIIDIGAYKGEWTEDVLKIYPEASYLMLEGNPEREKDLQAFVQRKKPSKIDFELALLDHDSGTEKVFHIMDTAASVLEEFSDQNSKKITIPTRTLNEVAQKRGFHQVSLMKLDVQGYELEVLKGGDKILPETEAVLLEVSLLDIHKNVPLIRDVLNFMYDYGFVTYDICSVGARRPLDRALWQTDLIFVKENSRFRQNKSYR
jgi:FkbM family methyltransferase